MIAPLHVTDVEGGIILTKIALTSRWAYLGNGDSLSHIYVFVADQMGINDIFSRKADFDRPRFLYGKSIS